jgi:hypothetical protein
MGVDTRASGSYSMAFGGASQATGFGSFAGGWGAQALNDNAVAMGSATASGNSATALGQNSTASGNNSFTAGALNTASGGSAVALGLQTVASGGASFSMGQSNQAIGDHSTALGFGSSASAQTSMALGHGVLASGLMSVAMGTLADTNLRPGAFVYGDRSTLETSGALIQATADNEFAVRAAGGFRFRTSAALTTGCNLPAGSGTWSCTSTRTEKHRFADVDGEDLLARLRRVPVATWSYRDEAGGVRHMGPFAEDFRAAFNLGVDDRSIGLQDIDGVALAAAQALDARTVSLRERDVTHEQVMAAQAERIGTLEAELARLAALVKALTTRQ